MEEFYFQWHFMDNCNLRCTHCYQGEEGYQHPNMNIDELLQIERGISETLQKWNMLGRISLTGGEPFLSPYLFDLMAILDSDTQIKRYDILTNGTCISDSSVCKLKQAKKLRQVQISLDGATRETHDSIRGKGVFDKVDATIKRLRDNDIEVALMFTIMRKNIDEAVQIIDFAEKHNVNAVTVERVTPCGNSNQNDILTAAEIKEIYTAITVRANVVNQGLTVRRLRPLWIHTAPDNCRPESKIGGFCPVGLTSLTILWDGTVLPCRRLNVPIGNMQNENLFNIWYTSEVLWRIRDKNNLKGKCHGCVYVNRCGGCRAIAYETTGDYMGEDIQCWI